MSERLSIAQHVAKRRRRHSSALRSPLGRRGKLSKRFPMTVDERTAYRSMNAADANFPKCNVRHSDPNGYCESEEASVPEVSSVCPPFKDRLKKKELFDDETCESEIEDSHKRKKYYFVANGDRPSEMYRTDLVHRMKSGYDSDSSDDDDIPLVRMSDRWKEEWNHGVQVPLHKKLPEFVLKNIPSSSRSSASRFPFKMGQKMLAVHKRRYCNDSSRLVKMPKLRYYQCDELDRIFLEHLNTARATQKCAPISEQVFGRIIDELEVDCHQAIHKDLLTTLNAPKDSTLNAEFDEDASCDVCRQPDVEDDDEIIFCDGCNVCVHQSCYGLDSVPPDEWLCKVCTLLGYQIRPRCILCPVTGGAMKCTKTGDYWAHVVCALWIPEVRFADVDHREPITNISDIPDERWLLKCSICDTKQGACIQCSVKACTTSFHVTCALRSGQVMRIENELNEEDSVRLVSLCEKHSRTSRHEEAENVVSPLDSMDGRSKPCEDVRWMEHNFFFYVSPSEIASRLEIDENIVNDAYEYWKLRRCDNGNRSMLSDISDVEVMASIDPQPSSSASILSIKVEIETKLRQNLEKARNLCYMMQRREKVKKELVDAMKSIFEMIYMSLTSTETPFSGRALERLCEAVSLNGLVPVIPLTLANPLDKSPSSANRIDLSLSLSPSKKFAKVVSEAEHVTEKQQQRSESKPTVTFSFEHPRDKISLRSRRSLF